MTYNKPSIIIYRREGFEHQDILDHISWGIEEEGIPYKEVATKEETAVKQGYNAAKESVLDIGIGVGMDGNIVLHYSKLEEGTPLFVLNIKATHSELRKLGSNAARLVKGIPLKTAIEEDQISLASANYNLSEIDVAAVIADALRRILLKKNPSKAFKRGGVKHVGICAGTNRNSGSSSSY